MCPETPYRQLLTSGVGTNDRRDDRARLARRRPLDSRGRRNHPATEAERDTCDKPHRLRTAAPNRESSSGNPPPYPDTLYVVVGGVKWIALTCVYYPCRWGTASGCDQQRSKRSRPGLSELPSLVGTPLGGRQDHRSPTHQPSSLSPVPATLAAIPFNTML